MLKILFFGDIVGSIGRRGVVTMLPKLRSEFAPDLVVANVENLAHGRGITPKTLKELDAAGVDAYTSGNHVWENPVGLVCFDDPAWNNRLVRPANVPPTRAGRGWTVVEKNGVRIALVNLMGTLFMGEEFSNPFLAFDRIFGEIEKASDVVFVDFHAEATSEKEAFGHYVDGRAAAVLGSHTHVPTADAKILPGGTAYQTDVGRCGSKDSVIGFEKKAAMKLFFEPSAKAYDPPESGDIEVNAALVTVDPDAGKAVRLDAIRRFC